MNQVIKGDCLVEMKKIEDNSIDLTVTSPGTTLKMAKKNNRNYIGIEISEEYIDIINKRLLI